MATMPQLPAPDDGSAQNEPTTDNPQSQQQAAAVDQIPEDELKALKSIRLTYKLSWSPKRQIIVRRILKAFEYLKGNPSSVTNSNLTADPISDLLRGTVDVDDASLYDYNDNVYQMLALSLIAALGPDVAKVRYMPDDPQNEDDLAFAKKASIMMATIERLNDSTSLQTLELLYLWCGGTYFCHVHNVIDSLRAGTERVPVYEMQNRTLLPDRYLCGNCGTPAVAQQSASLLGQQQCQRCGSPLGQQNFYPALNANVPVQVDEEERAQSMTATDVYSGLQVDVDPDAQQLARSPILDLEGEVSIAAIRSAYPEKYDQITAGDWGDDAAGSSAARNARESVTSPATKAGASAQEHRGTYSRCWIQAWAFSSLDDQKLAARLLKRFPKGCRLVTYGNDLVLEAVPESMLEHWTECRTMLGLGMYPPAIGDSALSVQDRLDDTANNIHIYQDRMALPPVLTNASMVDAQALGRQRWGGGRTIPVYPTLKAPGVRFNIQEAMWQPNFHADTQIYGYSQQLIMLMQLLSGVQPQIFGGGTNKGVDTASGQEQMLNTAMGRLMLYLNYQRAEKARRSKLAIKCMASDIDGQRRLVVPGQAKDQYDNVYVLEADVQGEFHAYPEADQGFPASYGEMRDRLMQILGMVEKNPVLQGMLSDPDMQKLLALYLLPDGAKLPGDAQRTKIKLVLQQLAKGQPTVVNGVPMPSIQPDPDFDNMTTIEQIATDWANSNYELAEEAPNGYANVRAYFKLASQQSQAKAAKQAVLAAAAGGGQGGGNASPPAGALPPGS